MPWTQLDCYPDPAPCVGRPKRDRGKVKAARKAARRNR